MPQDHRHCRPPDELDWSAYDDAIMILNRIKDNWHCLPLLVWLPITTIIPTRDRVQAAVVKRYDEGYRATAGCAGEGDQGYPVVVHFRDDRHFYLLDGHHRYMAACLSGLARFPALVDHVDQSLLQCVDWFDEDDQEDYLCGH